MLFAKMGVPNGQLAFFTTLLYFPWFLKGLWGPFVDIFRTKRWWILSMQGLLTVLCIGTDCCQNDFSRRFQVESDLLHHCCFCFCDA